MSSPRSGPSAGDVARDARLLAALRNAPDAELGAPAHVSAQIVAAGYRAAGDGAPTAARARRGWFGTPWRLGASGAFASVLLAGAIGLLWRGERPGPAREDVAAAPAAAPSTTPTITEAVAPPAPVAGAIVASTEPAPTAPRLDRPDSQRPPRAPAPSPTTAAAADRADTRARQEAEMQANRSQSRAPALGGLTPAGAASPVPTADVAAAPAPVSALANMPAAAPAAPAPEKARADAMATADAPRPAPPPAAPAARRAALDASSRQPEVLRPALSSPGATASLAMRAAPLPEAPWMSAAAAGTAVQWRIDGQLRTPTSSWLYALAAQSQGRWRTAASPPSAGEREVQWWQGGVLQGRLWLGPERVRWCDAQARCEEAVLDDGVGSALLKSL